MARYTWCGGDADCTTIVDLDDNPPENENREVLCGEHAASGAAAGGDPDALGTAAGYHAAQGRTADTTHVDVGGHKAYPETDYNDDYAQADEEYRRSGAAWQQAQDREATAGWGDPAVPDNHAGEPYIDEASLAEVWAEMDEDERANYPAVERALCAATAALDDLYRDDAQESAQTVDDTGNDSDVGSGW